jgi:hypothetical protein
LVGGAEHGHDVHLLDGDLVESPALVGVLLDEVGFFVGLGLIELDEGDAVVFVSGFFFRARENDLLAGETVTGGVLGAAFEAFGG